MPASRELAPLANSPRQRRINTDQTTIHLEADSHLRSSEAEFVRRSFHPKSRAEIAEIKEALFKFDFSQRVRRTGSRGIGDGGHSRALPVDRRQRPPRYSASPNIGRDAATLIPPSSGTTAPVV